MTHKTVSNEDILELLQVNMQLTSEGFDRIDKRIDGLDGRMDKLDGRMDKLDGRMDNLDSRMGKLERQYTLLQETVNKILGEQAAQRNDIKEILDRLMAIEKRLPTITEKDLRDMQEQLQAVVEWAESVALRQGIPLKFK